MGSSAATGGYKRRKSARDGGGNGAYELVDVVRGTGTDLGDGESNAVEIKFCTVQADEFSTRFRNAQYDDG